jgi:hypothetical protein
MLQDLLELSHKGFFPFMGDIDNDDAYHVYVPRPYIFGRNNKKNQMAPQSRVNSVSWIINPAKHNSFSNSISYFKRGDVLLYSYYCMINTRNSS